MIWLGILGQSLFALRVLWQWMASERRGRVIIPAGYWEVSLAAALLVLAYAVGVNNPIFFLSVLPGAVVAARNLRIVRPATRGALLLPAFALLGLVAWSVFARPYVGGAFWASLGLLGAVLWGLRHFVQWWVSERAGASTLPAGFWMLSLAGSLLLLAYAGSRGDPVMIAGYGCGCIPYARNLLLLAPRTNPIPR